MGDLLQPAHIIVLFVIFLVICLPFLIAAIFYIPTLQKTLNKCAPSSRTLEPGMVWLFLIPLVNLIFNFFIVFGLSKSLHNEFVRRGMPVADPTPGQSIGLAMCICACCGFIPFLGILACIANLVLWIMYWVKIAEYSRMLDTYPETTGHIVAV
jgi:hypothetical protein